MHPSATPAANHADRAAARVRVAAAESAVEAIERSVQAGLFFLMTGFLAFAGLGYTIAYIVQGRPVGDTLRVAVLVAIALACWGWAHRIGSYAWPLRVQVTVVFGLMCWATLQQGHGLPAAGWWLSVFPFIVAGGGFYRLAVAYVVVFIAVVTYLYAVAEGAAPAWFSPMEVRDWQRYAAVVGSELLTLLVIVQAMVRRAEVARVLEASRQEAEAAAEAKAAFLAKMSHEIRTPLNGVIAITDLLDSPRLNEQQRSHLLAVQRQSSKVLLALVNDVLDFSKLEAGKVLLEQRPFSLREVVVAANGLFSIQAFDKGIEITSSWDAAVPALVRGDVHRVQQVVNNLVGNAVKFTAHGGVHVHMHVEPPGTTASRRRTVRIEVADTGPGIAPEQLPRLFSAFVQAGQMGPVGPSGPTGPVPQRDLGGTGLGLSISHELARLMGGRLEVQSTPGQGSRFTLAVSFEVEAEAPAEPLDAREDIVVAAAQEGLRRHLASVFAELGMQPRLLDTLPTDEALSACRVLLIDATLLRGGALEPQLQRLCAGDRTVGLLVPLGSDALMGVPAQVLPVYKPVTVKGLQTVLALRDTAAPQPGPAPGAQAAARRWHVLVAEDNPVNQLVAQAMLAEAGASCELVSNGDEALERLCAERYDLLLLDMFMPGRDGLSTAREWRRQEATHGRARLPIIAMTANSQADVGASCEAAGMDGFLAKPFGLSELRACLERVARATAPQTASPPRP